ncbi:hypothetical protein FRB99_005115 [Tulasnella sp. 403]|nr:hypothetical protein FRB99_005115 [Tulasnella sp. 403]
MSAPPQIRDITHDQILIRGQSISSSNDSALDRQTAELQSKAFVSRKRDESIKDSTPAVQLAIIQRASTSFIDTSADRCIILRSLPYQKSSSLTMFMIKETDMKNFGQPKTTVSIVAVGENPEENTAADE